MLVEIVEVHSERSDPDLAIPSVLLRPSCPCSLVLLRFAERDEVRSGRTDVDLVPLVLAVFGLDELGMSGCALDKQDLKNSISAARAS